jgi:porphobilinogen synthase
MSILSTTYKKERRMFPEVRLRRLRQSNGIRRLLSTPLPGPEKLIWPTFVIPGENRREPIESMPGQARLSIDQLLIDLAPLFQNGLGGILLFGLADASEKDPHGHAAYAPHGTVQNAVRAVKEAFPQLVVIADVCICAYTDHGHCGPLTPAGEVDNDASLAILQKVACSMAAAGADMVAPSSMMDGQVMAIREALDAANHTDTLIMSYSTKFASSLYGPFRDAEQSTPGEGDRTGYQAAPGDLRTALRESELDEDEGADILMLKPALFYLDILAQLRANTDLPLAAYNVSGEYAMLHATAEKGWGDLKEMVRESILALSRSGADIIITYWANQYEQLLKD